MAEPGKNLIGKLLKKTNLKKPFFLIGGISSNDTDALKKFKHPFFYGVDVNSRFEKERRNKRFEIDKTC